MFSKEKINLGRQPELDFMKAFTVVFSMILIHVYDWDTTMFNPGMTMAMISKIGAGIWGAPIFMFAMGMGMKYGHRQEVKDAAWRGLKLLAFGQMLNFCRYAIPFGIGTALGLHYDLSYQILNFSVDIMQFAGLAFLFTALTWKLKFKSWHTLVLSLLMSLAGSALWYNDVQTGNYFVDQFLGAFWGTDTESFFPFLNWYIFVAAGKWFAYWYQRLEDKKKFFLTFSPISAIIAIFYVGVQVMGDGSQTFHSTENEPGAFCWMWLPDSFMCLLTFMFPMGICYWLAGLASPTMIKLCSHPSKYINRYYSVSWVWIVMASLFIKVDNNAGLWFMWFNMLCVTILTVIAYNTFLVDKVEGFCGRHSKVLMVLIWVVTLSLSYYAYANYTDYPNVFNDYFLK